MKSITENNTEIINDLIRINNDRVAVYRKAAMELGDEEIELKLLLENIAEQGLQFSDELRKWLGMRDREPVNATTLTGKIYRVWMDVKRGIGGTDRESILEDCEYEEDAALKAYESALQDEPGLADQQVDMIKNQRDSLRESHDYIKSIRNRQ